MVGVVIFVAVTRVLGDIPVDSYIVVVVLWFDLIAISLHIHIFLGVLRFRNFEKKKFSPATSFLSHAEKTMRKSIRDPKIGPDQDPEGNFKIRRQISRSGGKFL